MAEIETDYLVIGAGAAGMAFTDSLITESDADVVMVDRRHRPGGHWNDAYPFVRLHQPSSFYGVNSRVLGTDAIDEVGPNAGFYHRATAAEICDYFFRVLEEQLLPTGRVRFFGMCDSAAGDADRHQFVSRLTGETTTVRVRRRLVDATYQETGIPSTHVPPFAIDPDARLIPVNGLVDLTEPASGYTVIGAGKTAMDACCWLLDAGVAPDAIRWIRPRDAWLLNREYAQPLDRVPMLLEGVARNLESAAAATDVEDLFRRLEASEQLIRLDPTVEPTMYRCATVSQSEVESLRSIEHVVRQGRVVRVGRDEIVMEKGSIPNDPEQVVVDCSASGLRLGPGRPVFEPDRITLQQIRTCQPTFNAALIAFVETLGDDDAMKNGLCAPNPYPTAAVDWITATACSQRAENSWMASPEVSAWMQRSRLNAARAITDHLGDAQMQSAMARFAANGEPAIANLQRLAAQPG